MTDTVQSVHGVRADTLWPGDVVVTAHWDGTNRLIPVRTIRIVGDDVEVNEDVPHIGAWSTSVGNLVVKVSLG